MASKHPKRNANLPENSGGAALVSQGWEIASLPMLRTTGEEIFVARQTSTNREALYHRVSHLGGKSVDELEQHFSECAVSGDHPEFAHLLGWGFDNGQWCYLTQWETSEPLPDWKLRRQLSSATSIRMDLMLQVIQKARVISQLPECQLQLSAALTAVRQIDIKERPYRLVYHCWMPARGQSVNLKLDRLLEETERMLVFITAGMPWPLELTRVFHDSTVSPQMKLKKCEKIMEAQLRRSAQPALEFLLPRQQRSWKQWTAAAVTGIAISAAAGAWVMHVFNKTKVTDSDVVKPASQSSDLENAPAPVPPPLAINPAPSVAPALRVDEDISSARKAYDSAKITKDPPAIFRAATRLLQVSPLDQEVRATLAKLIRGELRHQIERSNRGLSDRPEIIPKDGWGPWVDLGFADAKLLAALETWQTNPTDSIAEIQAAANNGSSEAWILLGQLAAHERSGKVDLPRAFSCFEKAAALNDVSGDFLVGQCYYFGSGVTQNPALAIPYLRRAAQGGDARAMNLYGTCLAKGKGVPANLTEAAKWFHLAIAESNDDALANLAVLIIKGGDVPKDVQKGLDILKRGGDELKNAFCLYTLGDWIAKTGGPSDLKNARAYMNRAAELGSKDAQAWLKKNPDSAPIASKENP